MNQDIQLGDKSCIKFPKWSVCACVCVCVSERQRDREIDRWREYVCLKRILVIRAAWARYGVRSLQPSWESVFLPGWITEGR